MRACVLLVALASIAAPQTAVPDLLDAARGGDTKQLAALLTKGANLEARDKEGRTPLMLAAQYGRTAAVKLLLDRGAKPDARDAHGWSAYALALIAPSGGVVHRPHEAVLKLLPQPRRIRLAVNAGWTPGKTMYSSCFMRPDELTQHLREIRPDALVVEAFQRYAIASGRDLVAIVQMDTLGMSEVANKTAPENIDATLFLMIEPGIACVQQNDQISMTIRAAVTRPDETPVMSQVFGAGVKTGMRGEAATNSNQHGPIFAAWAKAQIKDIYWAVVAPLL